MKKALIHDWYYVNGGAEKVVKSFHNIWDDFSNFALVDFLSNEDRKEILKGKSVNTSFIQRFPTAKINHRNFLQWFPIAMEQFDLKKYDLILSSSASVAKGVLTSAEQLHICYCHSPMRYAWDLYHDYLRELKPTGLQSMYARRILHKMRVWDVVSSNRVDHFIANSNFVARRIKKIYNRDSTVIYPPVDVDKFQLQDNKDDFYFTSSRMVRYKRIDLIIHAFNKMPNKKLIVGGEGPEYKYLKRIAKNNIEFTGYLPQEELVVYLQNAKAFVFAAEEDFGIAPVQAQACGTPVIAFNKGGLRESIIDGKTGYLYDEQNSKCIESAIDKFEKLNVDYHEIRENSLRFSVNRFEEEIENFVDKAYHDFNLY